MKIYSGDFGRDDVYQRPESILQLDGWRRTSEVSEPGGRGVLPNDLEIRRAVGVGLHEAYGQRMPFVNHTSL